MIRFRVAGRTVNDIERAIAEEMLAAGIPSSAYYQWNAEGNSIDITTRGGSPELLQAGYMADVEVEYP